MPKDKDPLRKAAEFLNSPEMKRARDETVDFLRRQEAGKLTPSEKKRIARSKRNFRALNKPGTMSRRLADAYRDRG